MAEVVVVGAPDPEWGEIVMAFVVPQPVAVLDATTLEAFCLDQIARFERLKRYVFVKALPKNNYCKLLKTVVRAMVEQEAASRRGSVDGQCSQ